MRLEWQYNTFLRKRGMQWYLPIPLATVKEFERRAGIPLRNRSVRISMEVDL
jgi:hypothetical protein